MNKLYEVYVHRCFAYVVAADEEEALSTAQYALESINEVDLGDYFYFHEGENEGKYILCKDYLKEHDYLHLVGLCEVYDLQYESGNIERVPGEELDVHRIEVKQKHSNIYNMAEWMIEKKIKSLKEKQNIYSPNDEIQLYKISFNHDPNDLNNDPTFIKVPLDAFRLNLIVGYLQGLAFDVEIGWGISESDIAYLLSKYFSAVEYKEQPLAADGKFEEFTDVHLFWNWELVVCKYWDEIKEIMNLNREGLLEDLTKLNQAFNDKWHEKNIVSTNKTGDYQWTVRSFNVLGIESTSGYLSSRDEAIDFILDDGKSAFLLLVNTEDERVNKSIEYIKVVKNEEGKFIIEEVNNKEEVIAMYHYCYCEEEYFDRVISPPEEEFTNFEVKPSSYLISYRGDFKFDLWRELREGENESKIRDGENVENNTRIYGEKEYIWVGNFISEEDAMEAIKSYWRGMEELLRDIFEMDDIFGI
ncbi:hypothetical protein ACQVQY_27185 [Bacillus mycoides]|uniref:hypothetical protein n=1 Tax=Bacillus mycoides TaxID=1405 RepID=UPI003D65B4D8